MFNPARSTFSPGRSALDFLLNPPQSADTCYVLFGEDDYLRGAVLEVLRQQLLPDADDRVCLTRYDGSDADWAEVEKDLATVSMFQRRPRVIVIDSADRFISSHRAELEKRISESTGPNVLILSTSQWQSNTRLARLLGEKDSVIDCNFSRKKPQELVGWIASWARKRYQIMLDRAAAESLLESVGASFGLIDQELQKFASLGKRKVTVETVLQLTGTWRTKMAWDILSAALEGDTATALHEMHRVLEAGMTPLAVLGMITPTLRRLALATHLYVHTPSERGRPSLRDALLNAGVPAFAVRDEEERLRKLGRHRGRRLIEWLHRTDAALKGALPSDPRIILERFIVALSSRDLASGNCDPI